MHRQIISLSDSEPPPASQPAPLMSWHPARPSVAVVVHEAGDSASCRIFNVSDQKWDERSVLRHDFMRSAQCVAWAPLSETIAIGCRHGICLWRLMADGSSGWWLTFLQHPRRWPTHSLSWSPTGRHFVTLSSSSSKSGGGSEMLVWDAATRTAHALAGLVGQPNVISWSPTGKHLFSACSEEGGGHFSVWETQRWGMETFDFPGVCCAASWAPDGYRIAIVMDHVEEGDAVWVWRGQGVSTNDWKPATVLGNSLGGGVRVSFHTETGAPGREEVVGRDELRADKPLWVGTLQTREDTNEFGMEFESSFFPPFADLTTFAGGSAQLPSSAVCDLSWSAEGGVLVASYFVEGPDHGAVACYGVRHEPLSLSPLRLLDFRETEAPPQGCALWSGERPGGLLAAAGWAASEDLVAEPIVRSAGLALYLT